MEQQPLHESEPEPLCDPGHASGLLNLATWSLGVLVIWGIVLLGVWKLLSPIYQDQAGPQPAASPIASLGEAETPR